MTNGKGSNRRPYDKARYSRNYEDIFHKNNDCPECFGCGIIDLSTVACPICKGTGKVAKNDPNRRMHF